LKTGRAMADGKDGRSDKVATETRLLIRRGTAAFRAGAYAEAERPLLGAMVRDAGYANVHHMLGVIASRRGAPGRAIELFRRALALDPAHTLARVYLAQAAASRVTGT
jgi:Tfp pilus assembly protein PilF